MEMKNAAAVLAWAALTLAGCGGTAPAGSAPAAGGAQEAPADTAQRTVTCVMYIGGAETTVYLEPSDTQITLWDSASGGTQLLAAPYAQPLPGAEAAALTCSCPDLDGDGSSDLTADLAFADGTSASLVWFYSDGTLHYNSEFSRLPGELTAAGEAP